MKHLNVRIGFGCTLIAAMLIAGDAGAGPKTFVSIFGNDDNDCLTGPGACRTAQRGVAQVNPGGTVVFDSVGDFGTVVINKPSTLLFPRGGQIDVPANGNPPGNIIINGLGGNDTVAIDGLNMDLLGRAGDGILVNDGNLELRNSSIYNGGGANNCAIRHRPNNNGGLFISNSSISDTPNGVCIEPRNGADVTSVLDRMQILSTNTAIRSTAGSGSKNDVLIKNSTISRNTIGIRSSGNGSNVRVQDNSIFRNTTGLSRNSGGKLVTVGGNTVSGNTTNGTFSGTLNRQ